MKGSVFLDSNFIYKDGDTGKKYFIVVYFDNSTVIVAKTTSNKKRYSDVAEHCNKYPLVYYLKQGIANSCFPVCTYVQIDDLYEFSSVEMLVKKHEIGLKDHCKLPDHLTNGIINCIKKNKDDLEIKYHKYFK